jgi:hypothetical protein
MPTHFIGNVLPSSDAPGENDHTFDFTKDESQELNLTNIPIRIEHEEGLAVGSVIRNWTDDSGKKWILGHLHEDSLESRYASHAIKPSSTGHTLYGGLSLQHVHTTFENGSTKKRGIEVSLCTNPRRPGCEVSCVEASKKKEYITHIASTQNMSTENTSTENTSPEQVAVETSAPTESTVIDSAPGATPGNPTSQAELMTLVLDQENELGSTKVALERAQNELLKLQNDWKIREDNESLQTKSKAEALSKALVDSWEKSLPADMMTEENKKAIFAMAQNFPKESVKMLEIAHKASAKYKTDIEAMHREQSSTQKRELENRVMDVVTKRRRLAPEQPRSVVHAASAKVVNPFSFQRPASTTSSSMASIRNTNPHLFSALTNFSSGSLRDQMKTIADIGK